MKTFRNASGVRQERAVFSPHRIDRRQKPVWEQYRRRRQPPSPLRPRPARKKRAPDQINRGKI